MQSVSNANFGPLIAYLVPGATVLVGAGQFVPTLHVWLVAMPADPPTIGGFLYLTIASLAAGMTVSRHPVGTDRYPAQLHRIADARDELLEARYERRGL